jgi:IS30 family transposase
VIQRKTKGLLRHYFPKGTELSGYSPAHLNVVVTEGEETSHEKHWK